MNEYLLSKITKKGRKLTIWNNKNIHFLCKIFNKVKKLNKECTTMKIYNSK